MRRLGRYIFNGATVLSLLVCLATVVLWVRADARADILAYHSRHTLRMWIASHVGIGYYQSAHELDSTKNNWSQGWLYRHTLYNARGSGFIYERGFGGDNFNIGLPYWFICLITALIPAACLTARLRRKRYRSGLCAICGYDLRATPNRCPECGMGHR